MYLVADIGGTHARFALADNAGIHQAEIYRAGDYPSLHTAIRHYLATKNTAVKQAALSIAATLTRGQDNIELVNHAAWNFSAGALQGSLEIDDLLLLNDFEALAHAIPQLDHQYLQQISDGSARPHAPIGLIGPGTGLGMAGIFSVEGKTHVMASEGGNASLPIPDAAGFALIEYIRLHENRHFISAEDILSGPGLVRLYQAIARRDGRALLYDDAAAIASAAMQETCAATVAARNLFCQWLGVVAGDLALTLQASGGIYIAGGIIPQWTAHFRQDLFQRGFTDKGPYADYLRGIPVFIVTHPLPALEGLRRVMSLKS